MMMIHATSHQLLFGYPNHSHNNETESESETETESSTGSSNATTMPCYWSSYFRKRNRIRRRIDYIEEEEEGEEENETSSSSPATIMTNHHHHQHLKNETIIHDRRERKLMMMKNSSSSCFSSGSFLFSLFLLLVIPSLPPQGQAPTSRNLITKLIASTSESLTPRGAFFASASTAAAATGGSLYKINAALKHPSRPNSISENSTSVQQASNATTSAASNTEFLLNLVKSSFNQQQNGTRSLSMGKLRPGQQREHMHYKTTYACEGNQLDLSCQEGKLIHLVRANYGRFSVSICNDFGNSNLSVQCYSFRAFLLMETKCNKLSNCSVIVSKDLFGDPCEGTSKYLEVQYYCDDANNNNQQQQQIPSQPQMSSSSQQNNRNNNNNGRPSDKDQQQQQPASNSASAASAAAPNVHKSPPQLVMTTQQVGGQQQPLAEQAAHDDQQQQQQQPAIGASDPGTMSVIQQQQQQQLFCLPQTSARNLYWNYTRAGQMARQNCPEGSSGKAGWLCDAERLRFAPGWSPDFSQCRSNWLQRLAHQLDQMLEQQQAANVKQPIDWQRQQSEQMLRVILNDLSLMASTKELFSEDLKRIDIMISQIIAQLKSLSSVIYGAATGSGSSSSSSRWQRSAAPLNSNPLGPLYEELFNKLVAIVSSLFDFGQRSAWLDVQPAESRRKLEQRYLNHLKDSGLMLASVMLPAAAGTSEQQQQQQFQQRQANVLAGITVINRLSSAQLDPDSHTEFNLQLKPQATLMNRFSINNNEQDETTTTSTTQNNEFRLHLSILRELVNANGVARFLALDIKKPDYSLIRQQLESSYAINAAAAALSQDSAYLQQDSNNLPGDQQWSSRVFGVFAILGENGDVLDGNSAESALTQQGNKLVDLLAQWPISVDFKVPPATTTPANINQLQPTRQCNSLSDNVNQPNRCQTLRFNATNHLCRCDQFGFVALTNSQQQQQPPANDQQVPIGQDLAWPPTAYNGRPQPDTLDPLSAPPRNLDGSPFMGSLPPAFVGAQDTKQQQPLSIWTIIFIVLGLSVFIVSLATFVINAVVRATSQCRLNKKPGHFLSTGTSILGNRNTDGGPTTGPLATDHSLMSEPLTAAAATAAAAVAPTSGASTTTQSSGSIIGLTGGGGAAAAATTTCHAYKTHQQLYAAHYPALDGGCVARGASRAANRWTAAWRRWLRPVRWLGGASNPSKGMDHMGGVQHCLVGHHPNLANQSHSSAAYKSHLQNGYTTGLHQHHHHLQSPLVAGNNPTTGHHIQKVATAAAAAAPSSASSYVSSSAYYEEIGPGNLARVNTSQLSNTHTIVDPFKRQQPAASDQQLSSHHHPIQQQGWSYAQQQDAQHQLMAANNYGPALISGGSANQSKHFLAQQQQQQHLLHSDLSQLQQQQSSSSSAGSSASTSVTTANGSTPRHYLFASPSAVSAYKSSMGQQQQVLNQQQHLHQLQQQHYLQQQQQRFMPSG